MLRAITLNHLCKLCEFAYLEKPSLQRAFDAGKTDLLESPIYIENDKSSNDGQAFIGKLSETDACLIFRGTESMRDWLTDLNIVRVRMDIRGVPDNERPKVHAGFLRQYRTLDQQIISTLREMSPQTIFIAGHSLGGALATIASVALKAEFPKSQICCYTFGSPRVGNAKFATMFEQSVHVSERFADQNDPVPTTPFSWRFMHVSGLSLICSSEEECWVERELPVSHFRRFCTIVKMGIQHMLGYSDVSIVQSHSMRTYSRSIRTIF